jgi:hypothetical protein
MKTSTKNNRAQFAGKVTWAVLFTTALAALIVGTFVMRAHDGVDHTVPLSSATVVTDKLDYPPGATANITGAGFDPGESVTLQVLHKHVEGEPVHDDSGEDHDPWVVIANTNGGFSTTWHVCEDDCLGATLELTATGLRSLRVAKFTFTDGALFIHARPFGTPTFQYSVSWLTFDTSTPAQTSGAGSATWSSDALATSSGNSIEYNGSSVGNQTSKIQLTAAPVAGRNFINWTKADGTIVGGGSNVIVVLPPYVDYYANYSAAVTKADPIITWPTPASIVYGTPLSNTQLNATSTSSGALTYDAPLGTVLAAGLHTLSVNQQETDTHTSASKTVMLQVTKATPAVDVTWNGGEYNGNAFMATATVTGLSGVTIDTPALTFAYYSGNTASGTPLLSAPVNAGVYTVRASFSGNTNYASTYKDKSITIAPSTPILNVTWSGGEYSGNAFVATATVIGVGGATIDTPTPTFAYYSGNTAAGTPLADAPVDAGAYTVRASFAGSINYTSGYKDQSITITQATPTVNVSWSGGQYNGNAFVATATVIGVGGATIDTPTPTFAYYSGNTASGTPLLSAPVNAGTYAVRASFAGNTNYTSASKDQSITITQATPTVNISWSGGEYNGNAFVATATVTGVGGATIDTPTPTFAYNADG